MSTLSTIINPVGRGVSTVPDIANIITPTDDPEPTISFPEPVPQSQTAQVNSLALDAAVHANRRNTSPDVVEKRNAPRYSLRELNSLTSEQLAERMAAINPSDDRPGWVKALDLIDLPRNFVANTISELFLPEAKRMALQRNEFDQAGQVKVYGADLLRAMGVENKVVNGVGGFFVDIFTDPLSWIGGPIGTAKTVGTRGAIEITTTGRRTLNSAINSVRKGMPVSDSVTQKMLDNHIADGVVKGAVAADADNAAKAAYLQKTLFGQSGRLSKAADRVGLGKFTRGGTLAEDVTRQAGKTTSVTEAERISSVKDFVAKYTINPGIDLTKGRGGATVAHIPLTTFSLTTPSFRVPGMAHRFGGAQELQMALAKATGGQVREAQLIASVSRHANQVNKARIALQESFDKLDDARRTGLDDAIAEAQEGVDEATKAFRELADQGKILRDVAGSNIRAGVGGINDIPTLVATMDALDDAALEMRRAEALTGYKATPDVYTADDIRNAREARNRAANQAKARGLVDKVDEFFDALVDPSRRSAELEDFIGFRTSQMNDRWRSLFLGTDEDLQRASIIADTYAEGFATAQEIATRRLTQVRSAMNSDERLVADAMRHMLRISDRDLGHLPGMSFDRALQAIGQQAYATKMARLSNSIATNLGGVGGDIAETFRYLRSQVNGSKRRAGEVAQYYAKKLQKLMQEADIPAGQQDIVAELAGLMLEVQVMNQVLFDQPQLARRMQNASKHAQSLLDEATRNGVLQNQKLRDGLKEIANEAADHFTKMAREMVERGDIDNPLSAYVPLVLKREAARRAQLRNAGVSPQAADRIVSRSSAQTIDPTLARQTNLVEFTDEDGVEYAFTLMEAMAYHAKANGASPAKVFGEMSPNELANARRVLAGVDAFIRQNKLGRGVRDVSGDVLERALRDESVPMLPTQVNIYAADGRLDPIVGGELLSGDDRRALFDTNIVNLIYSRTQANELARAKESFRDAVEPFVLFRVDAQENISTTVGAEVTLTTGEKAKIMPGGRIKVGERMYMPISEVEGKFESGTLLNLEHLMGASGGKEAYIPDTVAVQLQRLADVMSPQQITPIMGFAETATSIFRTSTLLHPSWVITNIVGNAFLAAMSGMLGSPQRMKEYSRALKIATQAVAQRNAEHISSFSRTNRAVAGVSTKLGIDANASVIVNGQQFRVGDFLDEAADFEVIGQGRAVEAQEQMMKAMEHMMPTLSDPNPARGVAGMKSRIARGMGERAQMRASTDRLQRASDAVAATYQSMPVGGVRKVIRAWFQGGAMVDDSFRLAQFIMYRTQGFDAATAAQKVRYDMLNFGDMTSFEQNWIRPLVPFYAWLRASFPAYAVRSIKDPKQLAAIPKIQQGLEQTINGEERLPRHMRPRWLQETMAIQLGTDPNTRGALLAGTLVPQEGVITALQPIASGFDGSDMFDLINWGISQTGPVARMPFELATGREIFSGRDIGFRPGQGDISLYDYLLSQVRPIKELGFGLQKGKIQEAFEQSPELGVSRALIGGRLQSGLADPKRALTLYFEMTEVIDDLRRAVRRAENNGNDDQAAKFKFEILATYRRYLDRGVPAESIPKWAREDLAAFAPGSQGF